MLMGSSLYASNDKYICVHFGVYNIVGASLFSAGIALSKDAGYSFIVSTKDLARLGTSVATLAATVYIYNKMFPIYKKEEPQKEII